MVKRLGNYTVAIALGLLLSGTAANAEEVKTMTTTAPLNIRNGAGTQYSVLGSYDKNTDIEIISLENGWAKVSYNGNIAYCSADYLKNATALEQPTGDGNNKLYHYSKELGFTLDNFIAGQAARGNASSKGEAINMDTLNRYLNPELILNSGNPYQFLRINKFRDNINAEKLNVYLNSLDHDTFHGRGQAFIDAAREYNIDTLYLVAHTILETGYGKSQLARGVDYVIPQEQSAEAKRVKVYNLFGIGAIDSDPIGGGAATAYRNGWTSIEQAIKGGARWLSENYIHSSRFGQNQYTLYMMRWNTNNYINPTKNVIWHQYATDISWTDSIASLMKELSYIYEDAVLELEIPVFLKE